MVGMKESAVPSEDGCSTIVLVIPEFTRLVHGCWISQACVDFSEVRPVVRGPIALQQEDGCICAVDLQCLAGGDSWWNRSQKVDIQEAWYWTTRMSGFNSSNIVNPNSTPRELQFLFQNEHRTLGTFCMQLLVAKGDCQLERGEHRTLVGSCSTTVSVYVPRCFPGTNCLVSTCSVVT
jgi:hypothetical protein